MFDNDEERSNDSADQTRRQREPRGNFVEDEDHFARDDTSVLTNASSVRTKSKDAKDDMTASKMETFADIIAVAFVKANQHATKSSPSTKQTLGVTGLTLSSGMDILHVPRSGSQQVHAGVTSKHSRGDTESARLKRKKIVTASMTDKLACNNVLSLITADDIAAHDLAADCQQWQRGLRSFKRVLMDNDMITPFLIPTQFDIDDPSKLNGPFINLIDDFHKISDGEAQRWQKWICKYAAPVEIESAAWAVETMEKSMTAELKTLVFDDMENLELTANGAITMFKIATNHMVLRN